MERTLGTRTDLFLRGQEQELAPFKLQLDYLQDQQAKMITGFTSDKQTNLELSLAKLRRGEQLKLTRMDMHLLFQKITLQYLEKMVQNGQTHLKD
jgi:hypothetical protein